MSVLSRKELAEVSKLICYLQNFMIYPIFQIVTDLHIIMEIYQVIDRCKVPKSRARVKNLPSLPLKFNQPPSFLTKIHYRFPLKSEEKNLSPKKSNYFTATMIYTVQGSPFCPISKLKHCVLNRVLPFNLIS